MQRQFGLWIALAVAWLPSTAGASAPSLDMQLAVEIYDAQLPQVDRLVAAGEAKQRVLVVRACFEALRTGDRETARAELAKSEKLANQTEVDAPARLTELESVAAAALALADCDTNRAAALLERLPERGLRNLLQLLPPIDLNQEPDDREAAADAVEVPAPDHAYDAAAESAWNHLRARLLGSAGKLPEAYLLARQVANERADRLGFFHPDTLSVHCDAIEYGLPVVGAEKLYGTSVDAWRHPRIDAAPPEIKDRMVAGHSHVLLRTGRVREAIDLIECRIVAHPEMKPETTVKLLSTVSLCHLNEGNLEKGRQYAEDAWRIAEDLTPVDPWLRCRVLYALGCGRIASGYSSEELQPCLDTLSHDTESTAAKTMGYVTYKQIRARSLFFAGSRREGLLAMVDAIKPCSGLHWRGWEQELAMQTAPILHKLDGFDVAAEVYETYLPDPSDDLSPSMKEHNLIYAQCCKKLGKWETCLDRFSPLEDTFSNLSNLIEVCMALTHAEAVGHCGDWPKAASLNESIVDRLTRRSATVSDKKQPTDELLLAYQTLVAALLECQELEKARVALDKAEQITLAVHEPDSPWCLVIVNRQAEVAMQQHRYADAARLYDEVAQQTEDNEAAKELHNLACQQRNEAVRLAEEAASEEPEATPANQDS